MSEQSTDLRAHLKEESVISALFNGHINTIVNAIAYKDFQSEHEYYLDWLEDDVTNFFDALEESRLA